MAKFIRLNCLGDEKHSLYINIDSIESLFGGTKTIRSTSGEIYRLDDDSYDRINQYLYHHMVTYQQKENNIEN